MIFHLNFNNLKKTGSSEKLETLRTILMEIASSREPVLTSFSWKTLAHPLVAWKTMTMLLCKFTVLQGFWRLLPIAVLIPVICELQMEWQQSNGLFSFSWKQRFKSWSGWNFVVYFFYFWKCAFKSLKFSERQRRKTSKTFWLNIWKRIILVLVLRFPFLETNLALIEK